MGPQKRPEHRYDQATDAKDLLDMIGKDVHDQVKNDADNYKSQLKGNLSEARFENEPNGQQTENDPCKLDYTNRLNGNNIGIRAQI
ncbi:hypothetical protein PFDG_04958 [Plasmodium falciparum Dd2]|uniref:Plasmodium falciparum erythrocyte membrane protein-1 N-terminal segment domain-containing protein n=1 Tax=Plasmodium falciparum (isolate Dd2) TaxID=57267 RepID=A0A0L7M966_PLAF4|nr:hypothetical protein PFDG_04958 [Plasmodium falciparum Dd2]